MIFWAILSAMTLATLAFVALPFLTRARGERRGDDVAIYKDQLAEIERDLAAGRIAPEEAEAARIEVSRRLLKAAGRETAGEAEPLAVARGRRTAAIAFVALALPAVAAALYHLLGAPWEALPRPAAAAKGPGGLSLAEMVAKVEAHIRDNPNDGRGYEVLAPVYMRLGRFDAAIGAWRKAIDLLGDAPLRDAGLGEALVGQAQGDVTPEARKTFDKALALDAGSVPARYYLALAAMQDGKRDDARRMWTDMLAGAPQDAPWTAPVRRALAEIDSQQTPADAPTKAAAPGPGAGDVAAAAKMGEGERNAFIRSMVARLADRLKQNGDDPEGWARLVRAYGVLGEKDRADEATGEARKALGADAAKFARFENALKAPPQ
ncbi:MAG: c-type cytochrome biogenesis protein CcmI [Methylobacteriaceae bacterium]|nr:c-type cytochrome biogenesis protein CcmI [Methylobacteriaceae bacterium]